MSQEKVLKTLQSLGLSQFDAQVYLFLGKRGPQKGIDIAKALKMQKQHLYLVLKNLQSKGIVIATIERPARFSAIPFEKMLDMYVKGRMDEAQRIRDGRTEILSDWQSVALAEAVDQSPRFTVIEGRNYIYPRLKQMIEETKNQLLVILTVPGLLRADQFGLIDAAFNRASTTHARFRFLTEISGEDLKVAKWLLARKPKGLGFEGRTPDLGVKLVSRMLIRDDVEAVFFVNQDTNSDDNDICLWTNSGAIVSSFKMVFEDLWQNSVGIEKRIAEIESGRPPAKTRVISDAQVAKKTYDDAIDAAQTEIVMVTSSAGLIDAWKNIAKLMIRAEKGVSLKIMAPIKRDNLEAAIQLSQFCMVKHVPGSYVGTTIVDGEHLFQFKPAALDADKLQEPLGFENTFYTNDPEYVEKTKTLLNEVWKHAVAPSALTVEEITKPSMPTMVPVPDDEYTGSRRDGPYQKMVIGWEEAKPGTITEEYVLNKLINAKRIPIRDPQKDPVRFYGSSASAVIHPPTNFNLPNTLLSFLHCNKQSSRGAEDWLLIYLWLETPKGNAFVPVAMVTDNPKGMETRKLSFAGTPASQNYRVLKKDELQIQIHGNTFFAGWAVPIQLFPQQYILPPGAILFEGYGKLKPVLTNFTMPSGWTVISEVNGLEAFVTFFHPASKYSGPGTDGIISRDMIMTAYPPQARFLGNNKTSAV